MCMALLWLPPWGLSALRQPACWHAGGHVQHYSAEPHRWATAHAVIMRGSASTLDRLPTDCPLGNFNLQDQMQPGVALRACLATT